MRPAISEDCLAQTFREANYVLDRCKDMEIDECRAKINECSAQLDDTSLYASNEHEGDANCSIPPEDTDNRHADSHYEMSFHSDEACYTTTNAIPTQTLILKAITATCHVEGMK